MMYYHREGESGRDGYMPGPLAFREPGDKPATISSTLVDDQAEHEETAERVYLCKQCRAVIARETDCVIRAGKHLHTFFNPAGIVYEIGCFCQASGCHVDGPRSNEFSWFADYNWQISFCGACSKHLGWYFSSGDDTFFGLIVNRLKGA